MDGMNRRPLVVTSITLAAVSLGLAITAITRAQSIDGAQTFYYLLSGYPSRVANEWAARDAAAATGWIGILGWVLFAGALLAAILAVASRKPVAQPPDAESTAGSS